MTDKLATLVREAAALERALAAKLDEYEACAAAEGGPTHPKYAALKARLQTLRADGQLLRYQLARVDRADVAPQEPPSAARLVLAERALTSVPPALLAGASLVTDLSLARNGLTAVPDALLADAALAGRLRRLDLSHNQIRVVPAEIGRLMQLCFLSLRSNAVEQLEPGWSATWTQLETLDLAHNRLSDASLAMSDELAQSRSNLRNLSLSGNELGSVPAFVALCTNLVRLHLDRNRISELPAALVGLARLQWLQLGQNQLTAVAPGIAALPALIGLGLAGNQIVAKPEFAAHLRVLHLDGNPFWDTPASHTPPLTAQATDLMVPADATAQAA